MTAPRTPSTTPAAAPATQVPTRPKPRLTRLVRMLPMRWETRSVPGHTQPVTRHRALAALLAALTCMTVAIGAATPAQAATTSARSLLWKLSVAAESNSGYDRAKFTHWVDANGDCQDTRAEILIAESRVAPSYTSSSRCYVRAGKWYSPWDGRTWTNPSDVDIDHHVALAEAWGSGARSWTSTQRRAYANDLYGPALNAITDNVNMSKSDRDPAQWLPPLASSRCTYAITWVQVKYRWRLTIDSAERTKLASLLSGSCGSRTVTIPTRAR